MLRALIPTRRTLFFVSNPFQLNLNKWNFRLRMITSATLSTNLSVLMVAETVLEQCDSDNRHTLIREEQITVIALSRGKNSVFEIVWRKDVKNGTAVSYSLGKSLFWCPRYMHHYALLVHLFESIGTGYCSPNKDWTFSWNLHQNSEVAYCKYFSRTINMCWRAFFWAQRSPWVADTSRSAEKKVVEMRKGPKRLRFCKDP